MSERYCTRGGRVLAVLLIGGGAFGALLAVAMAGQLQTGNGLGLVLVAAFVAVFAWSAVVGVGLWQGRPGAWTWALLLFALQIPTLAVPGFTYTFYTGFAVNLIGGEVPFPLAVELGSRVALAAGGAADRLAYGVNLVAVAATVYLFRQRLPWRAPSAAI